MTVLFIWKYAFLVFYISVPVYDYFISVVVKGNNKNRILMT